jgi:hypothetical protein
MTDTSKYRNVSLSHATYKILDTLSKNLDPDVTLSISKTIEKIANEKVRKLNGKVQSTVSKYVCGLAGRNPEYVRKKMLNKVIEREASILMEHKKIKRGVENVIKLKNKIAQEKIIAPKRKRKRKNWGNVAEFKWLPKYSHDYVER